MIIDDNLQERRKLLFKVSPVLDLYLPWPLIFFHFRKVKELFNPCATFNVIYGAVSCKSSLTHKLNNEFNREKQQAYI